MSETGDGMDHLRIPYEKIKFGKKLESQGYGTVFEGEFDDQRVALKQLNITNLANIKPKLLAEILTISRFRQHPNLVALLGFCDEKSNEIILVYEYVANGNLEDKMRKRLTTIQRLEICLGAARGLHCLHTGVDSSKSGIVHGNIKLSKILLNSSSSKFEAKVSSFGLSKIVPGKSLESSDEVAEKPTKESDVYSFGVVLLVVLCGVSELVDTDDYQERHVSEIVPKKMEQNKLRKTVHFDIRKEIKTEALETYAKIACQCVMENPDARPQMAQVVEELEKALTLQGGEVTYVQIPRSRNIAGATDGETVVEHGSEDDVSGVILESNILLKEPEKENTPSIEEDVRDLIAGEKLDDVGEAKPEEENIPTTIEEDVHDLIAGEANGNEVGIAGTISERSTGEKNPVEATTNSESVPNQTRIEDAKNENSNGDTVTEREFSDDVNSKEKSNTTLEAQEEDTSKLTIKNIADKELDTNTTEETIYDFDSDKKSKIIEENKEDDENMEITTTSEPSNGGDTSTSTYEEVHESKILKSDRGSFSEVSEDELEHLRIPFDKIKFGQNIDVHGYGTLFEGEFNNQQVALKRLNITNLGNIKPKLLSAILTISRFRQHPNLVALIGFCDENNKEIILVYEYVSGGNLADQMSKHLNTIQRLQMCLGAARGVEYLHSGNESADSNPCIIHGNLKLSKILLNPDSTSSSFEAKVWGFGLPKLLPGQVEIAPKSTGKLTKEADVYSFGVLLLEVLCGVPELVDTDDYQERHVTELVPKRLEQNMLRKIVHFDIRDEITTESLETYAKIACRLVMNNPEERPTMSEVVVELEKALRLQGGKVSDVHIFGSSNGNSLSEVSIGEDDHKGENNGEPLSSSIREEEFKGIEETIDDINQVEESFPVPISSSHYVESVPENAETKNGSNLNVPESTEEITINVNSKIVGDNEVDNETKITTSSSKSDNGDDSNPAMDEKVPDVQIRASSNGNSLTPNEVAVGDDDKDNSEKMSSNITEEESRVIEETTDDIALGGKGSDVQHLGSSNANDLLKVSVGEDDQKHDENGETMSSTITQEESKVIEETTDDIAMEDAEKENGDNMKVPGSTEEVTGDLNSNEESEIIGGKEVNNESKITTSSSNYAMQEPLPDERSAVKEKGNGLMMNSRSLQTLHIEQIMEMHNSTTPDGNGKAGLSNIETPELIVNIREGDFGNSATQTQECKSKRSNSTCSESSNVDDTTPSDYLLPKSPDNVKKTSKGSGNCCCCCCSWWKFISDSIVFYGGLFWNKLISCFNWMTGQCSSKKD